MKKTLLSVMSLFFAGAAFAQVEDISVTAAPTAGYTWWDNNTAIKDGMMVGGQLGFGFGKGIELRGIYQQSVDLKSTVADITNDQDIIKKFKSRDVKVTRWGGEFKANIPTGGWLAPYLTLGSGVQSLKAEMGEKQEQIYATAGLGTKFNLTDRLTFNVEGKVSAFNMDPSNTLYDRGSNAANNEVNNWINENTSASNMVNWSVMAGLQFYLGGRTPEEMNAIGEAYNRQFGGGLRGFKLVVEPSVAYINFDDKTNMDNTYLVGGSAGFDFTEYVGVRGFYYQASKDKKPFKNFDKMAIYGGDFLARLNVARGVVPFITVGGGYMNVYDSYVGKDNVTGGKSGYFAKGGAGLTIPVGKFLEVYGAANLLLTTDNANDPQALAQGGLKSPDQLRKNVMYNAGLRFKLGAPANGYDEMKSYISRKADKMLEGRNKKVSDLEDVLKEAYKNNDTEKAIRLIREKMSLENSSEKVRLTPEQLQSLVNEVINGVEDKKSKNESTDERIDRLERLLLEVNTNRDAKQMAPKGVDQQILNELRKLNDKVQENTSKIGSMNNNSSDVVIVKENDTPNTVVREEATNSYNEVENTREEMKSSSPLTYKGFSAFTGVSAGDGISGVLGVKAHYEINNTKLQFVPDVMIGIGSKDRAYGINANLVYPINFEKGVVNTPYVGLGLGLNSISGDFRFGPNIIVGTSFNVLDGQLYVDYTSRNLFDNNQIAVGYRFGF